jgi:glyoxylase-like metal-dependent hydrolase (beta-lactamase superfamily II)
MRVRDVVHPRIERINAGVNCYLIEGRDGYLLVDTGPSMLRRRLLRGLREVGCCPGTLQLIVLTHGDIDHSGNAAHLRSLHNARIAAHELEARALATGDETLNRKVTPDRLPWIFKLLASIGRPFARPSPLTVDLSLCDGQELAPYGFEARIVHLPGHSRGSIGVLTADGALCCGDLVARFGRTPKPHPLIDDLGAARASLERIRQLPVTTVCPAHGKPFPIDQLPTL